MSWRMKVRHISGYRYQSPVSASYNEARITPLTTDTQTTIDSRVDISPGASPYRYWDYWGTLVHAFDIHVPHTELVVTGSSVVETSAPVEVRQPVGWDQIAAERDEWWEYLASSSYVALEPEWEAIAAEFRQSVAPADAVMEICAWVRSTMAYKPGATGVSTSALEALGAKQGVCQDFVHVFLGLSRSLGIPARYVSGYLHPSREPKLGEPVVGQSHAWAEAWVGDWLAVDPTNGVLPGPGYVKVARGRDYRDVSPLRGIYSGGAAHALEVEVELTRLG